MTPPTTTHLDPQQRSQRVERVRLRAYDFFFAHLLQQPMSEGPPVSVSVWTVRPDPVETCRFLTDLFRSGFLDKEDAKDAASFVKQFIQSNGYHINTNDACTVHVELFRRLPPSDQRGMLRYMDVLLRRADMLKGSGVRERAATLSVDSVDSVRSVDDVAGSRNADLQAAFFACMHRYFM